MPNLVARELLSRLNQRKELIEHNMGVIRRLEDRVQQLMQVNAEADAEVNKMRQDAQNYLVERERVLVKMKEFEERLARYAP